MAGAEAIFSFLADKIGYFDDYVSELTIFPARVDITIGWREPRSIVVLAKDIAWVRKGAFAQKNVITIMPVSGLAYELVADWDATVKLEIVEALKSIVPAVVRSADGGARGSAADHSG